MVFMRFVSTRDSARLFVLPEPLEPVRKTSLEYPVAFSKLIRRTERSGQNLAHHR